MTYLFEMPREPLILETQDVYREIEDPLELFLARKGWQISRVWELQGTIAAKKTIDLFTFDTTPLSVGERKLQDDIQEYLDSL